MHFQFYVRGIFPQVELWKSMAQGCFFKWRRTDLETGKEDIVLVQGALRPSVLGTYEYIFPKESLSTVLCIMGLDSPERIGVQDSFMSRARLAALRKILGVKKIPKENFREAAEMPESIIIGNSERGLSHLKVPGVAIHPIGIKEDRRIEMYDPVDKKTYDQEAL
jgi:hypothetical protein